MSTRRDLIQALPVTGAVKELVKEAKRIKASNPPGWTRK